MKTVYIKSPENYTLDDVIAAFENFFDRNFIYSGDGLKIQFQTHGDALGSTLRCRDALTRLQIMADNLRAIGPRS